MRRSDERLHPERSPRASSTRVSKPVDLAMNTQAIICLSLNLYQSVFLVYAALHTGNGDEITSNNKMLRQISPSRMPAPFERGLDLREAHTASTFEHARPLKRPLSRAWVFGLRGHCQGNQV
jgi:hypothetical protein